MDAFPELDIYFPAESESALVTAMLERATSPWERREESPVGRPVETDQYFFHRAGDTPCTVCLIRKTPGHLYVTNVVPDSYGQIPHDTLVAIIREFDNQIASTAAEVVGGMSSVGTSTHALEDYFSQESIHLLEHFCTTSNGLGLHPADQRKWMAFLLNVYNNEPSGVPGDVFGRLLAPRNWWPIGDIRRLVREYDFAMELLSQAGDD